MELVLFNAAFLWHLTSFQVPCGASQVLGKVSGICRKAEGGGGRETRGREEPPCLAACDHSVVQFDPGPLRAASGTSGNAEMGRDVEKWCSLAGRN